MAYSEEEYLPLSGLQHFAFCRRQWALIHIEQLWADNFHTADGTLFHERAHDKERFGESGRSADYARDAGLFRRRWAFPAPATCWSSAARPTACAWPAARASGTPFPVEYKRGQPPDGDWRRASALRTGDVPGGNALLRHSARARCIYGQTRRRVPVSFVRYAARKGARRARGNARAVPPRPHAAASSPPRAAAPARSRRFACRR